MDTHGNAHTMIVKCTGKNGYGYYTHYNYAFLACPMNVAEVFEKDISPARSLGFIDLSIDTRSSHTHYSYSISTCLSLSRSRTVSVVPLLDLSHKL